MSEKIDIIHSDESGRSLAEVLVILVVMTILVIFGFMLFRGALDQHEADRVYEEMAVTVSGILNRGTARTRAGFGDSQLATSSTRMGKGFSIKEGCPMNALTIKVDGVNQGACEYLMERKWPNGIKPLAFYRSANFNALCEGAESLSGGYYLESAADCTKAGAPDKGAFAVVFAQPKRSLSSGGVFGGSVVAGAGGNETVPAPVGCETDTDCNVGNDCLVCNPHTKMCEAGCTRLAYLQSNGTQYIDTGIVASKNTISEVKVQSSAANTVIIGAASTDSSTNDRYQIVASTSTYYSFRIDGVSNTSSSPVVKYSDLAIINLNAVAKKATVNGTVYPLNYSGNIVNATIGLFGRNCSSNCSRALTKAKVYYCKMWDNTELVRDFVPVRADFKTDGKQNCMFDLVTKRLFCNVLSGDFIGGEE